MRVPLRLALLLVVVTLAAGCGGDGPSPAAPASPGTPPTIPTGAPPPSGGRPVPAADPLTANPPAGTSVLPAARVDAAGLPPGSPTLVWTRGARTLGVYGRGGGCTEVRAEVAEQTAQRVVLRVVRTTTGGPCTRDLRYPPLEVGLAADLGERTVVLVVTEA